MSLFPKVDLAFTGDHPLHATDLKVHRGARLGGVLNLRYCEAL